MIGKEGKWNNSRKINTCDGGVDGAGVTEALEHRVFNHVDEHRYGTSRMTRMTTRSEEELQ